MSIRNISLILGVILSALILWMRISLPEYSESGYNPKFMLFSTLAGLNTWFWMLALIGLFARYFNKNNQVLKFLSRASYPFYILHFMLMVVIGYYLVELKLSILTEFIFFVLLSYISTFILYHLFKLHPYSKFFLGIKR